MRNKEVRDILLGRIVRQDEQLWTAAPTDAKIRFHGLKDGAGDVHLFGVTQLTRCYQASDMELEDALAQAEKALHSLGRPVQLESIPKSRACLYAPGWIAPVLICIEEAEDGFQMTAYTGRSLLVGWLRCRIVLWLLERRLPEEIICTQKVHKPDRKKEKQEKPVKREAKQEKSAKRVAAPKKKKETPKRLQK